MGSTQVRRLLPHSLSTFFFLIYSTRLGSDMLISYWSIAVFSEPAGCALEIILLVLQRFLILFHFPIGRYTQWSLAVMVTENCNSLCPSRKRVSSSSFIRSPSGELGLSCLPPGCSVLRSRCCCCPSFQRAVRRMGPKGLVSFFLIISPHGKACHIFWLLCLHRK